MNSETDRNSPISGFDSAWDRVKTITGWGKYGELAAFVGTSSQSVSGVKGRGAFPLDWAFKIAQVYNSTTDWIITGEGPMRREGSTSQAANGNGIVQSKHIEADEIHIDVHNHVSKEPGESYTPSLDPLDVLFVNDWHRLSEAGMMRVWTLLKEEIQKEKDEGQ